MKEKPPLETLDHVAANQRLRTVSGSVEYPTSDWLTSFLYTLMRDAAPVGEVEAIVREIEREAPQGETVYTNGWLAQYAKHLADRLRATGTK